MNDKITLRIGAFIGVVDAYSIARNNILTTIGSLLVTTHLKSA
ncbi:hypothetical protein [Ochrobactrum sp. Q0168]